MATFGKTSTAGSAADDGGGLTRGAKATLSEQGQVSSISLYNKVPSGTAHIRYGIYAMDAGGGLEPGTLLGTTEVINVTNTSIQWNTANFATPLDLVAGDYYLCWYNDGASGNYFQ